MRGDGCWKCRGELSSNVVTLVEADAVVAIGMDTVMGEDGKLVTTCCDSSGGLGESLLLVETKSVYTCSQYNSYKILGKSMLLVELKVFLYTQSQQLQNTW